MEKKLLLLESLDVTVRDSEVKASNFHGLENVLKGEAAHLSFQNWFLPSFQNSFLLRFVQQWGPLPYWHSQTTTSKWVNLQKCNKQPLVAANRSTWEVMFIWKKSRLDLADDMSSPPSAQHLLFCHLLEQISSNFVHPQQGKLLFTVPCSQSYSLRTIQS